nr:MAG TPA: hyaluronidase [Caudoviricetes sp.]
MTRIQVRRDTAANWSTNNPTPLAGEPCFETDTGKFKIGDGTTAYKDLAYQGDSTYTLPTASASTLGGVKIQNGGGLLIDSSSGSLSVASTISKATTFSNGIKCGGTNNFTTVNPVTVGGAGRFDSGLLRVKSGDFESFIQVGYTTTGRGKFKGIATLTSTNAMCTYGIYSAGAENVDTFEIKGYTSVDITPEVGTTSKTASTLKIRPNSLTFIKSDKTVVDLLAGSGRGSDVSAAGNNTFTGINTFNEPIQLKTSSNSVSIQQDSEAVGSLGENVSYDCLTLQSSTGDIHLNPIGNLDLENSSGEMSSRQGRIVNGTNGEIIPSINDEDVSTEKTWSGAKLSTLTNAAQAVHAAMPSNKYIDLELGASGTVYTAPADGYIWFQRYGSSANTVTNAYCSFRIPQELNVSVILESRANQNDWTANTYGLMKEFFAIKKDQTFTLNYRDFSALKTDSCFFRFIYAVGSEPTE